MARRSSMEQAAECWPILASQDASIAYALRWTTHVFGDSLTCRDRVRLAMVALGLSKRVR